MNINGAAGDIGALSPAAGLHPAHHKFFTAWSLKNYYSTIDPTKFAQMESVPDNTSQVMTVWGFGDIAAVSTPLTEGVSPTPQDLTSFRRDIALDNWGGSFLFTDEQLKTGLKQAFTQGAKVAGQQAKLTEVQICYTAMQGGTNVLRAAGRASTVTVAAGDVLDGDDVATAINTLIAAFAEKITEYGTGSQNTDTLTTDAGYIMFAPFSMKGTFENMTDTSGLNKFIPVRKYAAHQKIMDGEVGSFKECRIILDTAMPVLTGAGAAGIDVMAPVMFGRGAYTMARIGGNYRVITKMLGYGEDEIDQRASQGWKMLVGGGILYQNHLIRLEAALV